jgi:hypothetical protein
LGFIEREKLCKAERSMECERAEVKERILYAQGWGGVMACVKQVRREQLEGVLV